MNPGVPASGFAFARPDAAELDVRLVPRDEVRRLALTAGLFPPAVWPVTGAELGALLQTAESRLADERELQRLRDLRARFAGGPGHLLARSCPCEPDPAQLRAAGRLLAGYGDRGEPLAHEAALAWGPGWNTTAELELTAVFGALWATATPRLNRCWGTDDAGTAATASDPTAWSDWRIATGRRQVAAARRLGAAWRWDAPRAALGVTLGGWALSAGWDARRTGPGLTGALLLDHEGASFPALTARRTRPFVWRGVMAPVAPDQLVLRAGVLSPQNVRFNDLVGDHARTARPWFFQWLTGWRPTAWSRLVLSHSVIAVAREGSLWPDLLQVNLPLIGTTWREMESGPATDRLFGIQTEFRWRRAPWPLLPAAAGRLFWEYAGTDFLPSGPGGIVPEISIPASVAGCELLSPAWDLAGEYAELRHERSLWYTNGGFPADYSHRGWLLGHPLGGSGESWTGILRVRPRRTTEWEWRTTRSAWGMAEQTPGTGRELEMALSARRLDAPPVAGSGRLRPSFEWRVTLLWRRTTADPRAFGAAAASASHDWWQACLDLRF